MKVHILLAANPNFQLQIPCSFGEMTKSVKFIGIPENNFLCIFIISLIPRGAYFLLPQESKQEATSGWNFTKCISEVMVNQLKVKNIHIKMGISTFKPHPISNCEIAFDTQDCTKNYSLLKVWGTTCTLMVLFISDSGSRNFKGELGLFLTPVLMLWGGRHVARHVWRWVIVPSDLRLPLGTIYTHYHYCVIHRVITNMHDLSQRGKGNSRLTKLFGWLSYEKIRRYSNLPPYVMARWLPQQISPLDFLAVDESQLYREHGHSFRT